MELWKQCGMIVGNVAIPNQVLAELMRTFEE
jgi:hypothetical protein